MGGARAPDGSPVELYARLPPLGEPELIHGALPRGAEVLELGCGTGRITDRLIEYGHPVVGVDQSPEMLAHVRRGAIVQADIEGLDLGRQFHGVVLPSHLVNTLDDGRRRAFLETCRRHVRPDGLVLAERYDPEWASAPRPARWRQAGVVFMLREPKRIGAVLSATMEYRIGWRRWSHRFEARIFDDGELAAELDRAGLELAGFIGARGTWPPARPRASAG
ncbi:MAG: class I SAM-dependent methyltransferase [Actinomycetota bacterium]